jgi:hypothetical protein
MDSMVCHAATLRNITEVTAKDVCNMKNHNQRITVMNAVAAVAAKRVELTQLIEHVTEEILSNIDDINALFGRRGTDDVRHCLLSLALYASWYTPVPSVVHTCIRVQCTASACDAITSDSARGGCTCRS